MMMVTRTGNHFPVNPARTLCYHLQIANQKLSKDVHIYVYIHIRLFCFIILLFCLNCQLMRGVMNSLYGLNMGTLWLQFRSELGSAAFPITIAGCGIWMHDSLYTRVTHLKHSATLAPYKYTIYLSIKKLIPFSDRFYKKTTGWHWCDRRG